MIVNKVMVISIKINLMKNKISIERKAYEFYAVLKGTHAIQHVKLFSLIFAGLLLVETNFAFLIF